MGAGGPAVFDEEAEVGVMIRGMQVTEGGAEAADHAVLDGPDLVARDGGVGEDMAPIGEVAAVEEVDGAGGTLGGGGAGGEEEGGEKGGGQGGDRGLHGWS